MEAGKSLSLEIAIACYMAYEAAVIANRLTVSRAQISTTGKITIIPLWTIRPVTFGIQ